MAPRDVASRPVQELCRAGRRESVLEARRGARGVSGSGRRDRARWQESDRIPYGNLLEMYERITGEDPTTTPMRIYPAPHYTMGGLWVDYHLMSTVPGLFVLGEANSSSTAPTGSAPAP